MTQDAEEAHEGVLRFAMTMHIANGASTPPLQTGKSLDFAMSLADGRLFPQEAALARSPYRPIVLLEGPKPPKMPDLHPHALKGAMVSLVRSG